MELDKHELLKTLDPERLFGDELEAALDASLPRSRRLCHVLAKKLPHLGPLSSRRRRLSVFLTACTLLENRMAQGEADYEACLLAVEILRLTDKSFRRAVSAFEDAAWEEKLTSLQVEAEPGGIFARAYGRALYPSF